MSAEPVLRCARPTYQDFLGFVQSHGLRSALWTRCTANDAGLAIFVHAVSISTGGFHPDLQHVVTGTLVAGLPNSIERFW